MKILVTGSKGLVGSAIKRYVETHGSVHEFFFATRDDADVKNAAALTALFLRIQPDAVIHTAAKVGGIGGNMAGHADYFYENIIGNTNIIHQCHLSKVKKLLAFSSVCVFPDDVAILKEEVMHLGPPFVGNFAYAYAKRMVDVQIRAYKSQYGHQNWCSIIPGNIYGTHDLYNPVHGHVIPSLIHKLFLAEKNNTGEFPVWGDGQSLREFIYSEDLAKILVGLLDKESIPERLLVSGYQQYSIANVVEMLARHAKFQGKIVYDITKPNGQRNRQSDLSLLKSLFPEYVPTNLDTGLGISYNWFKDNYPNVRL
jgi:GDP-L-fucose synthase